MFQAVNAVKHQLDTGRDHQLVIGNGGTARQRDGFFGGIDRAGVVLDDFDAVVFGQARIRRGDVPHLLAAAQHQVGDGAGDESVLRLDQHHVNFVIGQQAHIFGGCGAAVAAAYHHHFGFGRSAGQAGATGQAQQAQGGARLQKGAALEAGRGGRVKRRVHGVQSLHAFVFSAYFFWAAK